MATVRNFYCGIVTAPLYFSLSDLEWSESRSIAFVKLISHKRPELGHMSLPKTNRRLYGKYNNTDRKSRMGNPGLRSVSK